MAPYNLTQTIIVEEEFILREKKYKFLNQIIMLILKKCCKLIKQKLGGKDIQ